MATRFVFDPMFDDNLLHWRGSLNPIGNAFRVAADKMATKVRKVARDEASQAMASLASSTAGRYTHSGKARYLQAKALAYSLRKYASLVYAAEIHGARANFAIVASGHARSIEIEFGGTDRIILAGKSPLVYSAMSILRRGMS